MIDFLFLDEDLCYSCKENQAYKYKLCPECLAKLDYVDNSFKIIGYEASVIYFYNDFMAHLIADYKFNRNTSLYKVFGQMVYEYGKDKGLFDCDYILAAPSSKATLNKRGFDHIKLIIDYFIDKITPSYLEEFVKIKKTKSQHTLDLNKRNKNLEGAFQLNKDIGGKSVLIFDDIITSGNTVKEIIKTLEKNQVKDIKILSLSSSHRVK
jgi:competence protein ComFC